MKEIEVDLVEEVKVLLGRTKLSQRKIARDTEVSPQWIGKVLDGDIKNPGYYTLKRVRDYLEGAKSA